MKVVDANVLLQAVNAQAPDHMAAKRWLDGALSGGSAVGFPWVVLLAFISISTRAGIFPSPLTVEEALAVLDGWLAAPAAHVVAPTARHASVLGDLLRQVGTAGNLTTDAHLAALAIEHRAQVVTFDADFARFPGVKWEWPT